MESYDSLKLENQLCFPLYLCSKEIIKKYTPSLKKLDLTYTQYIVMMYLWEHEKCNVKELGNRLFLESNTLTPLLKKLEKKGYIKREKYKKDERNLVISLTKLGTSIKDKALSVPKEVSSCIDLDKEEAKVLYKLIYKILNNLEGDEENDQSR